MQINEIDGRAPASIAWESSPASAPMVLLQLFLNGLQLGAIYALTAVGFSLIFGSTKIFHVAHGSAFAIAGYIYWWLATISCTCPGRWRRLRRQPSPPWSSASPWSGSSIGRSSATRAFFTVFIAAFGVQIIVQNLIGHRCSAAALRSVTTTLSRSVEIMPGSVRRADSLISISVAVVVFTALSLFLARTHIGMAMRALVGKSRPGAGVRPRSRAASRSWPSASARRSSVPGAILTAMTAGLNPAIGTHVMLISLAATIVGGIGSLRGAACGGLLLGLAENLALVWFLIRSGARRSPSWCCSPFILFRPSGFFGRPHAAKVDARCWPTSSTSRC